MTTQDRSNDQQRSGQSPSAPESTGGKRRLFLLIGLLALALFALWYDYKLARPAVEQAYDQVAATNAEINSASEHRRMTSKDVQSALKRTPSETFPHGEYTIEAYRWSAGMPIELRGLKAEESPGIGLKTHDYFAVYRQDGAALAFVTHFKFDLDPEYFVEVRSIAAAERGDAAEEGMMDMGGMGDPGAGGPGGGGSSGPGGGGPGGGGGFDPEAIFAERDADGDGKLTGEEISERMRGRLDDIDTDKDGSVTKEEFLAGMSQFRGRGGPGGGGQGAGGETRRQRPPLESSDDASAAEAAPSDDAPTAEPTEAAPAEPKPETPAAEPVADAPPAPSDESANDESGSES